MCHWEPMLSNTWSQQTNECLLIWAQSRIKACSRSWCCCSLYGTQERSSCLPLNQPGDWDERTQSSTSLPNVVSCEWCTNQWSPQVFGTHFQQDHTCLSVRTPLQCYPLNYYTFKIKWSNKLLPGENANSIRVWGPEYPQDWTHSGSSAIGPIYPWVL